MIMTWLLFYNAYIQQRSQTSYQLIPVSIRHYILRQIQEPVYTKIHQKQRGTHLKQRYATDEKKQQCQEDWTKDYKPLSTFQYWYGSHKNSPPE